MLVYLRIEIVDGCKSMTAYHTIEESPSYVWRYSNYYEGLNYFRTYMQKARFQKGAGSITLGII